MLSRYIIKDSWDSHVLLSAAQTHYDTFEDGYTERGGNETGGSGGSGGKSANGLEHFSLFGTRPVSGCVSHFLGFPIFGQPKMLCLVKKLEKGVKGEGERGCDHPASPSF